jgi:hypothetical protein
LISKPSKDNTKKKKCGPLSLMKNSTQNSCKLNLAAHQKDNIPQFNGIYPWGARMVQHTQTGKCNISN